MAASAGFCAWHSRGRSLEDDTVCRAASSLRTLQESLWAQLHTRGSGFIGASALEASAGLVGPPAPDATHACANLGAPGACE
eukprot:CAMPEP_0198578976 /NCGR_PEP_ID=MMETSP1462-20131121/120919_1 /TAXON_ID=1333877 /ORGANISM="Brandtodinium nutriculum, Strain RCC3387" /LENGTH=81 /DNA_ID=CAMNT_0044310287 /DNA_START=13 /DNA_END=255 /DNA_ORIENTATION=-